MTATPWRRAVGVAAFAGVLAAVGVLAAPLRIRLLKADPSYYLSYVLDYGDVAARYGQTYHGNRLSYLLIDRAAFALLGPETGYLAARWAALAVAVAVVVAVAAPRLGAIPALALAAAVGLTPWLPRQLLWTHYDGFATVHLLVAAWLLLGDPRSRWRRVAAGVALGLVVNANLGYAVVVATGLAAWLVSLPGPRPARLRALGAVALGAVAIEAVLSVAVRALVGSGPWFAEWIAIRTALLIAGDPTWFLPLADAVRQNPILLLLPVLGTLALVAARRPRVGGGVDVARFGGTWLGGSLAVVLGLHLLASSGWLGSPFYVVILLPPALVAVVGLGERLRDRPADVRGRIAGRATGAVLLAAWIGILALLWVDGERRPAALAVAAAALVVAAAALALRGDGRAARGLRAAAVAVAPAVLLVGWAASAQVPGPGGFPDLAARERKEWTLFHAVVEVKGLVAATVPVDRDLVFWHRVDGVEGAWLREVNMAYYGGGTGRLHADRGADPYGMPELRAEQVTSLRERSPVSIVLLGLDRAELTAGLVALATGLPDAMTVAQTVIEGDAFDLHVAVVEVG